MTENSEAPVNYAEHSSQYLRLRQSGAQGWSSPDEYDVMLRQVEPLMRSVLHGPKVLEIGSGAGNFSIMLAARGYEMHGFEVSDVAVGWVEDVTSDELINRYDPKTRNILAKGKPVRYIGTADATCEEIRIAGFEIDSVAVHPRMNAQDQDDLVLVARRAQPSNST